MAGDTAACGSGPGGGHPAPGPALSAQLALVQWLSPAFPTGAFACSHGLEWAIAAGEVRDGASLQLWLDDVLAHGAGWQDAVLLSLALRPGADLEALDDLARALCPAAERLIETLDQGSALARTVAALDRAPHPPACLPVALGRAAAPLGLPAAQVIALALHAFASNLVSVAVRFVPLGQTEGQAVLAALHGRIAGLAAAAAQVDGPEALAAAAAGADLAALRHETMVARMFRT